MSNLDVAPARARSATDDAPAPASRAGRRGSVPPPSGAIWAVRDRLLALRAEHQGGSIEAIALLARLVSRPSDVFAAEAFLSTGVLERGVDQARWRAAIEALPADARAGYDAVIHNRGGAGLAAALAEGQQPQTQAEPRTQSETQSEAQSETEPSPQAAVQQAETVLAPSGEYDDIALDEFIAPDRESSSLSSIIIGNAEGTRKPGGGMTWAYGEHIDPGNSARNRGSYSLQGATHLTPRQADRTQQERMATRIPAYTEACRAAGLPPTNAIALTTYFDLYNIKPALATHFAPLLPELVSLGVTHEHAIDLRVKASQLTQSRARWSGWEKIARHRLHKPSAQISDAEFWGVVRFVHTARANAMRSAMTTLGIRHPGAGGTTARTRPTTPQPSTTRQPSTTPRPSSIAGPDPRSYRLTGSVGAEGDNAPADVAAVQQRLADIGISPGPVDHRVGPQTIAAIRKYQAALHLEPDGLVEVGRTTERNLFGLGGVRAVVDVPADRDGDRERSTGSRPSGPTTTTGNRDQPSARRADGMYTVGGYPSSVPAGHAQVQYAGSLVTASFPNIVVQAGVHLSPAIVRAATVLAPYLPHGSHLTSGVRTDDHQARVIVEKAGGLIHGDLWQSYLHANGGRRATEVAWVGNSNHRAGLAFDLAGAPLSLIVDAVIRARREHPDGGLHGAHVERRCVHVNVDG